jgi:cobalamin biosynthesis Co2+ chelatase CbiK
MIARSITLIAVLMLFAGIAAAQDYPILNMVADRVIEKYNSATCEQVWQDKEKPKGEMEQRLIQMLRENPQMRQVFIDKVAAVVANKMFECGLVP